MKKATLILIILAVCYQIFAQEKTKQSEIGLAFSNLNNFGMSFKVGSNKFKWRFMALQMNGGNSQRNIDSTKTETLSSHGGFGLCIGNEFHNSFSENFEFVFGYDFFYNYSMLKFDDGVASTIFQQKQHSLGFDLAFGFNYIVKEHIVFGAEILPFVSWDKGVTNQLNRYSRTREGKQTSEQNGFNYGLTNTSARLLLAYRF